MEEKFKQLFYEIFKANGENELHEIVKNDEDLKKQKNWYPYGGNETNFATIENQQPTAERALVEKVVNSTDALLLKSCKQAEIDPEDRNSAPKTMGKASKRFFNIPSGDISLLEDGRADLAKESIQIIATGDKNTPDIMVYDSGEGQHPENFSDTFLSLHRSNKTNIHFVQGKYNMGSTGIFAYCGEYRYQLICSKRDQKIFDIEKEDQQFNQNYFGWTLVRFHELTPEEEKNNGSSWYEYFAIDGKTIPYFEIENLDIGLFDDKKFITGSFIKLYSYQLSYNCNKAISSGTKSLYVALNQLLYKPALPMWLYEKRDCYQYGGKGLISQAVYGNYTKFNNNQKKVLERGKPFVHNLDNEIGEVEVRVYVLKPGVDIRTYIDRGQQVVYLFNGQVHGCFGKTFITDNFNYGIMKNSMLVAIDCSKLSSKQSQHIFMANRSNVRNHKKLDDLNKYVIQALKDDSDLVALNSEMQMALHNSGNDAAEKELIDNLWKKAPLDPSLSNLLRNSSEIYSSNYRNVDNPKSVGEIETQKITKRFPTIFKIKMDDDTKGKKIKSIPLNSKGIIEFKTDVDRDYLSRIKEKGELKIQILGSHNANDSSNGNEKGKPNKEDDIFDISKTQTGDGSIKLTLNPRQDNLNVGDEIKINARLTSPDGDLESIFYVKIIDPKKVEKITRETKPRGPKAPDIIKISKNDDGEYVKEDGEIWTGKDWQDNDVIQIVAGSNADELVGAIAINMDSDAFTNYKNKSNPSDEKALGRLKKIYIKNAYYHGLFLYAIVNELKSQNKELDNEENVEDLISDIFKKYTTLLLYLDTNKEFLNSL